MIKGILSSDSLCRTVWSGFLIHGLDGCMEGVSKVTSVDLGFHGKIVIPILVKRQIKDGSSSGIGSSLYGEVSFTGNKEALESPC